MILTCRPRCRICFTSKRPVAPHAFVVEAVRRGDRGCRQRLQRLRSQLEFFSAGRELAVSTGDRAGRADAATGRHFEIAGIDALLVVSEFGTVQCPNNVRMSIENRQRESEREPYQPRN